jgi:hypothetical protein
MGKEKLKFWRWGFHLPTFHHVPQSKNQAPNLSNDIIAMSPSPSQSALPKMLVPEIASQGHDAMPTTFSSQEIAASTGDTIVST